MANNDDPEAASATRGRARPLQRAPGEAQSPAEQIEASPAAGTAPGAADEQTEDKSLLALLTPREIEILTLTARGLTARQIAGELGCKQRTVQSHRASIARKGVRGSVEMTHFAIRTGLVEP